MVTFINGLTYTQIDKIDRAIDYRDASDRTTLEFGTNSANVRKTSNKNWTLQAYLQGKHRDKITIVSKIIRCQNNLFANIAKFAQN